MTSHSKDPETNPDRPAHPGLRILEAGLLIAGSAFLGGLAVAFWHRKSLSKLRQPVTEPQLTPNQEDAETE
ncbi:MAG: hypothetical protein WA414_05300 [Acidobacteriaceae bacterium]